MFGVQQGVRRRGRHGRMKGEKTKEKAEKGLRTRDR